MRVYKVVSVMPDGSMRSALACDMPFGVDYVLGEKTVPKVEGSFLCAFESLENALHWQGWGRSLFWKSENRPFRYDSRVLLCECVPADKGGLTRALYDVLEEWTNWKWYHPGFFFGAPPAYVDSTVLCSSITPIEEVAP